MIPLYKETTPIFEKKSNKNSIVSGKSLTYKNHFDLNINRLKEINLEKGICYF